MKLLSNALIDVLNQTKQLSELCCDKTYTSPSFNSTSSIGQHVRHILDHIIVFKASIDGDCINYNDRSRGSLVESEPEQAIDKIEQLTRWLATINLVNRPIQVISEISINEQENIQVESNIEREMIYLINHTIHHVAYATLVAKQLGIEIHQTFGIAPATASYLRASR